MEKPMEVVQCLNQLKAMKAFNVAVFIVRYKNGGDIGAKRFEIIARLTKKLISELPHTTVKAQDVDQFDRSLV